MDRPHVAPALVVGSNPFATRYVASARLAPRDGRGDPIDLPALARRLERLGGTAAIVGAHGTGKSTLLAHLAQTLGGSGRSVLVRRAGHRVDLAGSCRALLRIPRGGTLCLDSFECLGPEGRLFLRGLAWSRGVGLLVTSHRPSGLPTLLATRGTPLLLAALARDLPGYESWFGRYLDPEDIVAAATDSSGDMRMAFDRLYDRFERRSRGVEHPVDRACG